MELVDLIFQDKHNTPINQTNKTQEHATHTLYDTHQGRKAPTPQCGSNTSSWCNMALGTQDAAGERKGVEHSHPLPN